MIEFRATYYDGRDSTPHAVVVSADGAGNLVIAGLDVPVSAPLTQVIISDRLGNTTRSITLPGGAKCETLDNDAVDALAAMKGREGLGRWVHRWESSWRMAVLAVGLVACVAVSGFVWGIPILARHVAMNIPKELAFDIGAGTLETLDRVIFSPTKLPEARREELRALFGRLARRYEELPLHLEFRRAGMPNAFALPNGTVVVTDELVELAERDEQILGVLSHEIGHVHHRHTLRMALESASVGLLASATLGDATELVAASGALPALYANAQYSQAHETEADTFAIHYLDASGIARHHFADMLRLLDQHVGDAKQPAALQYLSSHPPSRERIERFRGRPE